VHAVDSNMFVGTIRPRESYAGTRQLLAQIDINGHMATIKDQLNLYPIVPGKSGTIAFDEGRLRLSYDSMTVFKTVLLQVDSHIDGSNGRTYILSPGNTVLRGSLKASVSIDSSRKMQGLFFRTRSQTELLDWQNGMHPSVLTGPITHTFGDLFVAVDSTAPSVSRIKIRSASRRNLLISFRFKDDRSGVEYNGLKMYIDGRFVIPHIDGEHSLASYQVIQPLKRGAHQLKIRIRDRMGNANSVVQQFTVR
jgi:hypothetical protein